MVWKATSYDDLPVGVGILAGGLSRRMGGGDKSLLEVGGESILSRIIRRVGVGGGGCGYRIALNANDRGGVVVGDRFGSYGLPIFGDVMVGDLGPLVGILSSMEYFAGLGIGLDYVVVVAGDVPFVPVGLVGDLCRVCIGGGYDVVFSRSCGRVHPVVSVWRLGLRGDLFEGLVGGVRRVDEFAGSYGLGFVDFDLFGCGCCVGGFDLFFNINCVADLGVAEEKLGVCGEIDV